MLSVLPDARQVDVGLLLQSPCQAVDQCVVDGYLAQRSAIGLVGGGQDLRGVKLVQGGDHTHDLGGQTLKTAECLCGHMAGVDVTGVRGDHTNDLALQGHDLGGRQLAVDRIGQRPR